MPKKTAKAPVKNPAGKIIIGDPRTRDTITVTRKAFEAVYKNKGFKYIEDAPDPDLEDETEDLEDAPVVQAKGARRKAPVVDEQS